MSTSDIRIVLATASCAKDYRRAKRLAESLPTSEQFALVDDFIAARARIGGEL